jgi:Na+/proline symporter
LTPEQHNKYLSWAHFGYAGISAFMTILVMGFMFFAFRMDPKGPPFEFVAFMMIFFGIMFSIMIIPSIVAGYALRKRKRWAKVASIIAGVTAAMQAPFGTAVCVYTFWFLFSEPGKSLYDNPQRMLPQERVTPFTVPRAAEKEAQYAPPPAPPDWR